VCFQLLELIENIEEFIVVSEKNKLSELLAETVELDDILYNNRPAGLAELLKKRVNLSDVFFTASDQRKEKMKR